MRELIAARIDEDVVKTIKALAKKNNRSFSNQVEVILTNAAKDIKSKKRTVFQ